MLQTSYINVHHDRIGQRHHAKNLRYDNFIWEYIFWRHGKVNIHKILGGERFSETDRMLHWRIPCVHIVWGLTFASPGLAYLPFLGIIQTGKMNETKRRWSNPILHLRKIERM